MAGLALVLAATFAVCGQSPGSQNPPVTFETRAAPLPRVVAAISELTGKPLFCGGDAASEIVVVRVKSVPLSELKKQLAYASTCRWESRKDGDWIVRDKARALREERAELESRKRAVMEAMRSITSEADKEMSPAFSSAVAKRYADSHERARIAGRPTNRQQHFRDLEEFRRVGTIHPGPRLVAQLLKGIDPARIAAIRPGDRLVFALSPTPAQLPLGRDAASAVAKFLAEQQTWADSLAEFAGTLSYPDNMIASIHWSRPLQEPPARVLLSFQTGYSDDEIGIALTLGGRAGAVLYKCKPTFFIQDLPESDGARPTVPLPDEVELSPESQSLIEDMRRASVGYSPGFVVRVGDEWAQRLARPESVDPLAYVATDEIFAVAKSKNRNLVAAPHDALNFRTLSESVRRKDAPRQPLYGMKMETQGEEGVGWCVIRPSEPARARAMRVDRPTLGRLLRAVVETGRLPVEAWCEYLASRDVHYDHSLAAELVRWLRRDLMAAGRSDAPVAGLQLYGALTPAQRRTVQAGGGLAFASLSPRQRLFAAKMVFGAKASFDPITVEQPGADGKAVRAYIGPGATLELEPTEALPSGHIPPDSEIRLSLSHRPAMCASSTPKPGLGSMTGLPNDVGANAFSRESRETAVYPDQLGVLAHFWFGRTRNHSISLRVSPTLRASSQFSEADLNWKEPGVPFDKLPKAIKDDYLAGYASAKEHAAKRGPPP